MTFTRDQKRLAAIREWHMRVRVYPRFVGQGRMTQEDADRGIAIMKAISEDYREPDLFEGDGPPA